MILIELTAAIDAAGTTQTFYLTTGASGFTTSAASTPANTFFEPRLIDAGSIGVHAFADGRTGGASKLEVGEIIVANADGALDGWIDYAFDGRPVKIRVGEDGTYPANFVTVFSGTVEGFDASFAGEIVFRLRDKMIAFDSAALTTRYAGNNALPAGREGVAEDLKGKTKPRALGKVLNVPPPCVNTSRLIFEVGVCTSVEAVYDRGLALTAGAAYATLADLEATAPAAGQYRTHVASGFIRLGSAPAGLVTVDLTNGPTSAAQIINRLALDAGVPAGEISAADVTALDALNAAPCGIWLEGDVTVQDAVDQIAASVGAFVAYDTAGLLRIGRLSAPTGSPAAVLRDYDYLPDVTRRAPRDNGIPIWRAIVRYARIWATQATDLAGAVTAARRAFLSQETRTAQSADATIKTKYLLSDEAEFDGLLTLAADAEAEAARLLALHKVRRDVYDVPVPMEYLQSYTPRIADVIELHADRFDLTAGKLFRVIGYRLELAKNQALITLWG